MERSSKQSRTDTDRMSKQTHDTGNPRRAVSPRRALTIVNSSHMLRHVSTHSKGSRLTATPIPAPPQRKRMTTKDQHQWQLQDSEMSRAKHKGSPMVDFQRNKRRISKSATSHPTHPDHPVQARNGLLRTVGRTTHEIEKDERKLKLSQDMDMEERHLQKHWVTPRLSSIRLDHFLEGTGWIQPVFAQ